MTKKGVPKVNQPEKHRDQTEAFYCGQLLHYGLKPLKTKGPAKKALLAALDAAPGRRLQVPPSIQIIEADLVKQFEKANKTAKTKADKASAQQRKQEADAQAKRKGEDDALMASVMGRAEQAKVSFV